MYEKRKLAEIIWVGSLYPPYDYDEEGLGWLHIERLPLPNGRWNKPSTELLIPIPELYPEIPPMDFYLDPDIRDRHGHSPAHYFMDNAYRDQRWAWLCLHMDKGWSPAERIEDGDNLLAVVERIQVGLSDK